MPYNNTPIAPPKETTGAVSLPLARVKKIIHADDDIASCSNNAAFVITIATEMFIQYLAQRSYEFAQAKPGRNARKQVGYEAVSNAVSRLDNLEFLADVVPQKTTVKKALERQQKRKEEQASAAAQIPSERRSPIQQFSAPPAGSSGPHAPTSGGHSRGPSGSGQIYMNGTHHSPSHSFQGPSSSSRANPVNLLDDGDAMELDRPPTSSGRPPSFGPVPTTMELLERARAAQARAELGLSSHSPNLPPGGP